MTGFSDDQPQIFTYRPRLHSSIPRTGLLLEGTSEAETKLESTIGVIPGENVKTSSWADK